MQWHARMDAVKMRHLEYARVPVRVHENGGGFDVGDINGGAGGDETISSAEGISAPIAATPVNSHSSLRLSETRTSELTISFEGEVYVFHAVTPEKCVGSWNLCRAVRDIFGICGSKIHEVYKFQVQAVLLLLGGEEMTTTTTSSEFQLQISEKVVDDDSGQPRVSGRLLSFERIHETPTTTPSSEFQLHVVDDDSGQPSVSGRLPSFERFRETPTTTPSSEFQLQVVDDDSGLPSVSRRLASLERFREKRKERCFDKKIRYSVRKEVAQRMHRKNGQFASKDDCDVSDENLDSGNSAQQEPGLRTCQHCGICETSTPAMRRGPAGPRTLCNACGLMWANKGTLRELGKGDRHTIELTDPEPLKTKPSAAEPAVLYCNQDEKLDRHRTPEQTKPALMELENPSLRTQQNFMEITERIADVSSIGIENSSGNLGEQVCVSTNSATSTG